jgi:hypothetical protein
LKGVKAMLIPIKKVMHVTDNRVGALMQEHMDFAQKSARIVTVMNASGVPLSEEAIARLRNEAIDIGNRAAALRAEVADQTDDLEALEHLIETSAVVKKYLGG